MEPLQILRKPAVSAVTGLSISSLDRMVAAGQFPRPIRLSQRTVGWPAGDVQAWIADRAAQRDTARAA